MVACFKNVSLIILLGTIPGSAEEKNTTTEGSNKTVDATFSNYVDKIFDLLKEEDFNKIRRRCLENLNVPGGISIPTETIDKICVANDLYRLFDVMCLNCKPYWNWMNIRILEKMVGVSKNAEKLIDQYKNEVFSRKVKDLMLEISNLEVPKDKFTKIKDKWGKDFDHLTIKDVVVRWTKIEEMLEAEGAMLFETITSGCVEICWLIPNNLVEHAIHLTTTNQSTTDYHEFYSETLSLKLGEIIITDTIMISCY